MAEEQALAFECEGSRLYGVLSLPDAPAKRGVLIVVGGPQYRAGSHRQFTLLARSLAARGIPAMRFDYRGMGDSEGARRDFDSTNADLRAAVNRFFACVPGLAEVVLWGLCDGASAASFYAREDRRVAGLVLLNPWVRTEGGAAKARLKHYYSARLLEPDLWRKIARGDFDYAGAAASAWQLVRSAMRRPTPPAASLPERVYAALNGHEGKILVILSGADLTAHEFSDVVSASAEWQRLLAAPRVTRHTLPAADHTCSRRVWHDQVAAWTGDWVQSW
jgi:exosortase A-associated hydrolase 1